MNTIFTAARQHPRQSPSVSGTGAMLTLSAAAALFALSGFAQTAEPATQAPAAAAPQAPAAQQQGATVAAGPKYSTRDIAQAFGFIDGNKDGRISREEAAGFRGVARHFDEADLNKDSVLSREEFANALNVSKNR